jgi:hypothetical protein
MRYHLMMIVHNESGPGEKDCDRLGGRVCCRPGTDGVFATLSLTVFEVNEMLRWRTFVKNPFPKTISSSNRRPLMDTNGNPGNYVIRATVKRVRRQWRYPPGTVLSELADYPGDDFHSSLCCEN